MADNLDTTTTPEIAKHRHALDSIASLLFDTRNLAVINAEHVETLFENEQTHREITGISQGWWINRQQVESTKFLAQHLQEKITQIENELDAVIEEIEAQRVANG